MFLAMALGTLRHQGVDVPPPNTVEGFLYALPEDRAARVSSYYGYSPLDPAHLAGADGIVFVKDVGEDAGEVS